MANFLIPAGQKRNLPMSALLNRQPTTVRDVGHDFWFSPLTPSRPTAPDSYLPRQYAYQPGANLIFTPKGEEGYGYDLLRAVADSWDLLRIAIEMKKDEICGVEYEIRLKRVDNESEQAYKERSQGNNTLTLIKSFWEKPDGFRRWKTWLRMLVEDLLVLDAMAVYAFRDKSGKVAGFMPTDATTWNRILTEQGVTPNDPDSIAYQQVMYGLPAWDGTTQDVIYRIQNERTNRRYGYSRVERLLITISFGLNRQKFQLSEYTSGNVPEGLVFVPPSVTPQKIRQWQSYLDSVTSGNLEKRRQLLMLPGGDDGKPTAIFPKQALLKDELDEWLWQMVAACVGVSSQPLMKMMNRASGEEMNDAARERFLKPDIDFVCDYVTDCLAVMGLEDFELASKTSRDADIVKQANADKLNFGVSRTANELREAAGLDPMPGKNASRLGQYTPLGFVPLDPDPEDIKQMQSMKAPAPMQGPNGKPSVSGKPVNGGSKKPAKKGMEADVLASIRKISGDSSEIEKYSYGCVMIPIDQESDVGQAMKAIRYSIPDDHLMTTANGVSREEEPHITVRYGIRNGYQNIGPYIENLAPFTVKMGKTMAFEPSEHSDGSAPLVVKVAPGRRLSAINAELATVAVFKESDFEYTPHATLAYVKPEYAHLYTDDDYLDGLELPVSSMVITRADESAAKATHKLSGSFEKLFKFNPNHAPGGTPEGGEFTSGAGSLFATGIKLKPSKARAFEGGKPVETKVRLGKAESGKLGENIVLAHLQQQGLKDARPLNSKHNNTPLDAVQNHSLYEIKTGMVYSGNQKWGITIGEPSAARKQWLRTASQEEKAAFNRGQVQAALDRKTAAVKRAEKEWGAKAKAWTMTTLINPDTRTVDLFQFKGFHSRIGFNSDTAKAGYVGSYKY